MRLRFPLLLVCVFTAIAIPATLLAQDYPLTYSSTMSGSSIDTAFDAIPLFDGTLVIVGSTASSNFPALPGVTPPFGGDDAFVARLDPQGAGAGQLLWTTFLGGNGLDVIYEVEVDESGRIWVAGYTESTNFPTTPGAYQTTRIGPGDGFVSRLDPATGALEWSTYFGGNGRDAACTLEPFGDQVWIAGTTGSTDLPASAMFSPQATPGGGLDMFLTLFDSSVTVGPQLLATTYLGGSGDEGLFPSSIGSATFDVDRVAIDRLFDGRIAIAGSTTSTDWPTTANAVQSTIAGDRDTTLAVIDPALSGPAALVYSTYLGGTDEEQGFEVRWLFDDTLAFAGTTVSTDFPTTANAFQPTYGGGAFDGYLARIDPSLAGAAGLLTCTYFGGTGDDSITGLEWLGDTVVAAVGNSRGPVITTFDAVAPTFTSGINFSGRLQVFDLGAGGNGQMLYSTFLAGAGGSVLWGVGHDGNGTLAVAGWTSGDDYPVQNPFGQAVDLIGAAFSIFETPFISHSDAGFRRGDANADGILNIADAITILGVLFQGAVWECDDAGDVNDDGTVNIADAVFFLGAIFPNTSPPPVIPPPTIDCGLDPTPDGVDCAVFPPTCT